MEAKSSDWLRGPSGPTVCRCCFAEGCYKDISTEYFWMGKREVYDEMLTQTFDINITFGRSTGPNSNSRLICEPCIARLRDAAEFKRQVQECERMFMDYLDPGPAVPLGLEATPDAAQKDVKVVQVNVVQVKVEKGTGSDDGFADQGGFDDDDDDDDDLDDQPLTRLATKVPKKESVDLFDLLDNAKGAKRKSTTKAKSSPAKKAKTKKETPKATTSKPKPEKKKKDKKTVSKATIERRNAELIVQYSTAYPFRLPGKVLVCVYCSDKFEDALLFRKHMDEEHEQFKVWMAFGHVSDGDLKVDCTDLRCRMCSEQKFSNLKDVAEHLLNFHEYPIDLNNHLGLQPFTLFKDTRYCAVCSEKFPCLRTLSKHTQTHFVRVTCETCGKSYSTSASLTAHRKFCNKGNTPICRKCLKSFPTLQARKDHYVTSKLCRQHTCNYCGERFYTWNIKQQHMENVHGKKRKEHQCPECKAMFNTRSAYAFHFKITHTTDFAECKYCGKKFDSEYNLKKHVVGHTGEKSFECPVCSKTFPRSNNLKQHMWIHMEIKRFECKPCNKQFTQKISWKTHMRSHHPERELSQPEDGDSK